MKKQKFKLVGFFGALLISFNGISQTNVFDNVIATSPNHNYLEAALIQQGLATALQNPAATLTVFAPDDAAFTSLATALGTDITGLLALPNLTDILLYHVLGSTVPASGVTNGAIVQPLSPTNTLKLTATGSGSVFVNHAQVSTADLTANNGVVHVLNKVLLPIETVADVAIDNGFSTLVTAVVTAELLPALTNPLVNYTVFAPTNDAFDDLAADLGTTINGLLALPELASVLTYHVLGTEVASTAVTNGAIVQPLSTLNTLKLTKTTTGDVFVNHAQVTAVDINADNGIVHVLDAVVLPIETVVDVAIDNGFSTLTAAIVKAELVPVLTDPFSEFTVFAPTNTAFNSLAIALGTDLNGILALPNLADILTYHVVDGTVLSNQLVAGPVGTLSGDDVIVTLTGGVKINDANVTTADVLADNGVVHVIDKVLLPSSVGVNENQENKISVFPNPTENFITIEVKNSTNYSLVDLNGRTLQNGVINNNDNIDLSSLNSGSYILRLSNENGSQNLPIIKK